MNFNTLEDKMQYFRALTDYRLMPNSHVIVMLDGRSFSKLIKNNYEKPFSDVFINMMNDTAKYICENVQGCKFGYVQSDEISLLLTDFDTPKTESFFGYRLSKILSIIASLATSKFTQLIILDTIKNCTSLDEVNELISNLKLIQFDCKAWNVPTVNDVYGWFLYRQNDCIRNSISQTAQTYLKHKELQKVNTKGMLSKLLELGIDWNEFSNDKKFGRFIIKQMLYYDDKDVFRPKWVITNAYPLQHNKKDFLDYYEKQLVNK